MILTFVAATGRQPVGGSVAVYELANALCRRGHEVHLVHRDFHGERVATADEITWCSFEPDVIHHFPADFGPDALPDAEVVFHYDPAVPERCGLPVVLVQGTMIGRRKQEQRMLSTPCPKLCVARWLVDLGRGLGIPDEQLVHVPCGLRHEKYRVVRPIAGRPAQVSMLYHRHPLKGTGDGIEALERARREVPELSPVVFGTTEPADPLPDWIDYRRSPSQTALVEDVYNGSRVFLMPSVEEGFGLPALEAMACGAALVATDNGGSAEYAVHGQTALVAPAKDPAALADHVVRLLRDDGLRIELATAGRDLAQTFTWDASAARVEDFLGRYRAEPDHYRWAVTT